mmetsp:Transcript_98640/g.307277  ORF Transcript_98640/g.307277 Transcript_98640/m.307277 type:complete len:965 (-) Transcript_98640:9-2903(-)
MATAEPIMVGMRLRPLVGQSERGQVQCIRVEDLHTVSIVEGAAGERKEFSFDVAMDSTDPQGPGHVSQERCYELMGRRMLDHMLQGYNTCLFCYGQTGTGKTTTIMGKAQPPSEQGLLMRLISDIFREAEKLRAKGYQVHVKVQMLEVYNERLNDLIADKPVAEMSRRKVDVHVHPDLGVYLTGATEAPVQTFQDCITLIEYGNTMKTVHSTAMNSQSSRGHTVFKLRMEKRGGGDSMTLTSEVYFADLAGRENEKTTQVKGDRLVELSFINRSLMWLTNCIQSLGGQSDRSPQDKRKTVGGRPTQVEGMGGGAMLRRRQTMRPQVNEMSKFRNSKLTLLLSNALNGNSRTAMIGTLSPALHNFEESYSTLKFASTVKNIKLEAKVATAVDKENLVKKLQQEVQDLKRQLSQAMEAKRGNGSDDSESDVEDLSNKLLAVEALVESEAKDWAALEEEEDKIGKNRILFMEKLGTRSFCRQAGTVPYLSNYSEDPHLAFTLIFHVPPDGKDYSAGAADTCNFVLPLALGITGTTCWVRNEDGRLLIRAAVTPFGLAKVEVNSDKLGEAWQELRNLDCILFGRSTTFFAFLAPSSPEDINARVWEAFHQTGSLSGDAVLSGILGEERASDPMALELARQYYTQVEKQNMGSEGVMILREFVHSARNARKQVEEANDITKALRPTSGLRFELVAEAPVMSFGFGAANVPELCVRLSCRNAPKAISDVDVELLSVWTWAKFCSRLELMHAEYEAWSGNPVEYKVNPQSDPWAEYGPGEMLDLQKKLEEEKEKVREREQAKYIDETSMLKARESRLEADNRSLQREMQALRAELAQERKRCKQELEAAGRTAALAANKGGAGLMASGHGAPSSSATPSFTTSRRSSSYAGLGHDQVTRCLELTRANRKLVQKLFQATGPSPLSECQESPGGRSGSGSGLAASEGEGLPLQPSGAGQDALALGAEIASGGR